MRMKRRIVLICGAVLFVTAFWLPAVAVSPPSGNPNPGWACAWLTAYGSLQKAPYFREDDYPTIKARVLNQASWTLSGWISPLVAILLVLSLGNWSPRARRTIAIAIPFLMVAPFIFFFFAKCHPLAGHFVWMAGSLLIAGAEICQGPVRKSDESEPVTFRLG